MSALIKYQHPWFIGIDVSYEFCWTPVLVTDAKTTFNGIDKPYDCVADVVATVYWYWQMLC